MKSTSKPKRPPSLKPRGIYHVGLKVSKIEKSRKFYREILGFQNRLRNPGVVYVQLGKDRLVLFDKNHGDTDFHFGFTVKTPQDVERWRRWLRSNKIRVFEDSVEHTYSGFKIRDPDGHWIEISQER